MLIVGKRLTLGEHEGHEDGAWVWVPLVCLRRLPEPLRPREVGEYGRYNVQQATCLCAGRNEMKIIVCHVQEVLSD